MLWWTLKQLKSANSNKRWRAAHELGESKDARAVEPLTAILNDQDYLVRREAVIALGKIGDARAVESLVATLHDGDSSVRETALEVLKRPGWHPANDAQRAWLAVAQRHWDEAVSLKKAAIGPLVAALKDNDSSVRAAAVKALSKIVDEQAVGPLVMALKDEDSAVRKAALETLKRPGWHLADDAQQALAVAQMQCDEAVETQAYLTKKEFEKYREKTAYLEDALMGRLDDHAQSQAIDFTLRDVEGPEEFKKRVDELKASAFSGKFGPSVKINIIGRQKLLEDWE